MARLTRQRTAIRDVITIAARPLTPQEILDGVRASVPETGMATIYRNIKVLLDEGAIQPVTLPGESPRYETRFAGHEHHHHHFHCTVCDRVFDIPGCPGPMTDLAPPGFRIDRHELTLYGHCAECAAMGQAAGERQSAGHLP